MIIRRTPRLRVQGPTAHQRHASTLVSSAVAPASEHENSSAPIQRYHPTQPPSHKPPHLRKTQLHRQYTSLLQSTPVMLLFQHNNLKATEWAGIRRELDAALKKADAAAAAKAQLLSSPDDPAAAAAPTNSARLAVIQTNIFAAALRVVEHFDPATGTYHGAPVPAAAQETHAPNHFLSAAAYRASTLPRAKDGSVRKKRTTLDTLLSGPIAVLGMPVLSPAHLAAALRILAPTPGAQSAFPAPRRRDAPGLYEPAVQAGLQKLMLLGARVDGKVMDTDGVKWVGGLAHRGGVEGLRAEVVALLQSVGMGLVSGLDSIGMSVWGTLEGRRQSLEGDADKPS